MTSLLFQPWESIEPKLLPILGEKRTLILKSFFKSKKYLLTSSNLRKSVSQDYDQVVDRSLIRHHVDQLAKMGYLDRHSGFNNLYFINTKKLTQILGEMDNE